MKRSRGESSFAVTFQHVSCQIKQRLVLDDINLDIKAGDVVGVLGPNGAGKTTLLSLVTELRGFSKGQVTVLGAQLPTRGGALRKRLGVVFQETALYDELTVMENLRFSASLYAIPDARERIGEVLKLIGLADRSTDVVKTLSGGLRRRVAIARALLHRPELLIIDEPTLGVDVDARHAIWSHLRLLRSAGATVLVSTNYLDEALAICDQVAVLRQGRLLIADTPAALVKRAGSCLDIECKAGVVHEIGALLKDEGGVIRLDPTSTGVSVFLRGNVIPDNVMRRVLQASSIEGFRVRAPDLAEIFRTLEDAV